MRHDVADRYETEPGQMNGFQGKPVVLRTGVRDVTSGKRLSGEILAGYWRFESGSGVGIGTEGLIRSHVLGNGMKQ